MPTDTPRHVRANAIKAAKALIEAGWTQGVLAMDAEGRILDPTDPEACKFCAQGALVKAVHDLRATQNLTDYECESIQYYCRRELKHDIGINIVEYNDETDRKPEDMVAAFQKTIDRLEGRV